MSKEEYGFQTVQMDGASPSEAEKRTAIPGALIPVCFVFVSVISSVVASVWKLGRSQDDQGDRREDWIQDLLRRLFSVWAMEKGWRQNIDG